LGSGVEIEYLAMNDRGTPRVFLDTGAGPVLATSANFPTAVFKGVNTSTGEVDMYTASTSPVRKKFAITDLSFGKYTLTLVVQTPRARNVSSSGFLIDVGPVYEANSSNRMSYSPSKGFRGKLGVDDFAYGLDWARDERNFDSGAVSKEEVPVSRVITTDTRAQRILLTIGTTSVTVAFSTALDSTDYSLTCTLSNIVDSSPVYRPLTITNFTASGFTLKWNDPLDTGNYYLNYTATKFV
jgi:hypothetical protein